MSELNEFEQFYRRQAQIWRNIYLSTSDESLKKQAQREFETCPKMHNWSVNHAHIK